MQRIDYSRNALAASGRYGDRYMAHVAPGEMIVPPVISDQLRSRLQREMREAGISPQQHTVGSGMSINPITGLPEFGWVKKKVKSAKKVVKKIAPYAAPIAGGLLLGPAGAGMVSSSLGAAIGSGAGSLATGGSLKDAILSAGGAYAGGKIGGQLFPQTIGQSIGFDNAANLGTTIADALSGRAANAVINTSLGSVIGSMYGSNMAGNAMRAPVTPGAANSNVQPVMDAFKPQREAEQDAPASLTGAGALSPMQRTSNIANQGVYGGGAGPQEESYFLNQMNRRLVDDSGAVDSDFNDIAPIEQSYLQQLGLGRLDDTTSLLEAISRRRKAA